MKITYIYHDCFLIETEQCSVLTDYFRGVPVDCKKLINRDKPLYLIVSHHHKDHFSTSIFSWWREIPEIRYIVSMDVAARIQHLMDSDGLYKGHNKVDADRISAIGLHEEYKDGIIKVIAFESTDIGNSYVIEVEGKKVFFAGDLNAWTWRSESSQEESEIALGDYVNILRDIRQYYDGFDFAIFPVDPRMGADACEGGRVLCSMFSIDYFVPMHFELWDDLSKQASFVQCVKNAGDKIVGETGCRYLPLLQGDINVC